jgi:exopolyphosphatase/guanosine-5'-triphosphate,3'-diphosphate pyrophosphatase
MRVAAVDIGTNSVLLLVAERREGELRAVVDRATITRLGEGVDARRTLADTAVERTLACLRGYAEEIAGADCARVGAVATSALRDARGGDVFLDRAAAILGVRPEVVSGEREARLGCEGALEGLGPRGRLAVFDVGGGSTEIIVARRTNAGAIRIVHAVSLDIGSVRLTERHVRADPPARDELRAVRAAVRAALAGAPDLADLPLVGVAGTVTTLAALVHAVAPYDGRRVHGAVLSRDALGEAIELLARLPLAERRRLAPIDPGRADVIVAGAVLVDEICAFAGADRLTASDRGVRWGLALELHA